MIEYRRDDRVVGPRQRVGTVVAVDALRRACNVAFDGEYGEEMFSFDSPDIRRARFVRTRPVGIVHRQECPMARRGAATPWLEVEHLDRDSLYAVVRDGSLRTCAQCRPTGVKR